MKPSLLFNYHKYLSGLSKDQWCKIENFIKEQEGENLVVVPHTMFFVLSEFGGIKNKHFAKTLLMLRGSLLSILPMDYRDDESMVRIAMKQNPSAFQFASQRIRSKWSFVKRVVFENPEMLEYVDSKCIQNKRLAIKIIVRHPSLLMLPSFSMWIDNKDFGMELVKHPARGIRFLSPRLKNDDDICKTSVKFNPLSFEDCPERLKADKKFCLYAIKKNYSNIFEAKNEEIKADIVLTKKIMKRYSFLALSSASEELQRNKRLLSDAINHSPFAVAAYLKETLDSSYEFKKYFKDLFGNLSQKKLLSKLKSLNKEFSYKTRVENEENLFQQATEWLVGGIDGKYLNKFKNCALNNKGTITAEIQKRLIENIEQSNVQPLRKKRVSNRSLLLN